MFNLIDLNSTRFPCFEKVNLSPISLISPSRSLSHQTTNFLRNTIVISRRYWRRYFTCCYTESRLGLKKIFQLRCQRDQPQKPNFSLGATSKKSTETEWKKSVCHILVKERRTFGKYAFLADNTAF